MKNICQIFVVIMALLGTPAAAEIIELRCVTNSIDSAGNIEVVPDTNGIQNILVFNTSDRSVRYAAWPDVSATYWDEEFIAWTAFSEEPMIAAAFMFNRSSGILLVATVSSWELRQIESAFPFLPNKLFHRCTRTF